MNCQNITIPAVAGDIATLYVALELSSQSWLVGLQCPASGEKVSIHTLPGGDIAGLVGRIESAVSRLRARGIGDVRVVSCYEAGRDGFWLDRALRDRGIANVVIDAASIAVPRRRRRAKTDRLDLHGLLRELVWLSRGESACRVVRVPTVEQEDARRPGRERERLIAERVAHVNRLTSLCALHGIKGFKPLRADRRAQFMALRTAGGGALPTHLCQEMARELGRLELALKQIKEIEAARDAAVRAPAAAAEDAGTPMIRSLVKLKAIGVELGTRLTREALYRDFNNRRQVGRFCGLDGSPWQSGNTAQEQGISKSGNWRARVAAIELAWLWVRYQPDSALSRWFKAQVAGQSGAQRRKKIVALARKLMIALWRYVRFGLVPEGARLKPAAASV